MFRLAVMAALGALLLWVGYCFADHAKHREVYVAEPAFVLVDFESKDVFVFHGKQIPREPGQVVGVDEKGREVRVIIVQQAPAQMAPAQAQPAPSQGQKGAPKQATQQAPQPAKSARLASLTPSCADCHTRGKKTSGGFALFDERGQILTDVEWGDVLKEIEAGRMPKPSKPKVSAQDLDHLRRLAGK